MPIMKLEHVLSDPGSFRLFSLLCSVLKMVQVVFNRSNYFYCVYICFRSLRSMLVFQL